MPTADDTKCAGCGEPFVSGSGPYIRHGFAGLYHKRCLPHGPAPDQYRAGLIAGLRECAELADAFEAENFAMCTDGIMNDPVLKAHRGTGLHLDELTEADWHKSEEHQTHSTIHSSMAHAARNIATAIRAMIAAVEEEAKS